MRAHNKETTKAMKPSDNVKHGSITWEDHKSTGQEEHNNWREETMVEQFPCQLKLPRSYFVGYKVRRSFSHFHHGFLASCSVCVRSGVSAIGVSDTAPSRLWRRIDWHASRRRHVSSNPSVSFLRLLSFTWVLRLPTSRDYSVYSIHSFASFVPFTFIGFPLVPNSDLVPSETSIW